MADRIRITDVSPRDGLQNEPRPIAAADKVRLVDALSGSGVDEIEVSSFVSPKWVPQLGDAAEVFARVTAVRGITYSALVPNERGLESAIEVRAASLARTGRALPDKLSVFTAASQTFSRRNTNATIEETITRFAPIAAYCRSNAIPLRGYVSCAIACPFEGPIAPDAVRRVAAMLLDLGIDDLDLGDTIGAATPESTELLLRAVAPLTGGATCPLLTLHLHDTFGHAASSAERAMALGVRSFDSSAGGLGGCPYASTPTRRAPGNISTASLLGVIERSGHRTGIDGHRMAEASRLASAITGACPQQGDAAR